MGSATTFEERVLEAADALFNAHGVHAVGMDRIRDLSGVSLKRLYQCFPSKGALVEAYLRRRDEWSRGVLALHVARHEDPEEKILSVFDWLYDWFRQSDFRGCVFINAFGELGAESESVAEAVRHHKGAMREFLLGLARAAQLSEPERVAEQMLILVDGATCVAAVNDSAEPALSARAAAEALVAAARRPASSD